MMVGTAYLGKGGIAAVVKGYFKAGIMERLNIRYYATHKEGLRISKIIFYFKALLKIIKALPKYDIVHIHTASHWSFRRLFLVICLSKLFGKGTILHLHGGGFAEFFKHAFILEKFIIRYGFFMTDKVVVLTNEWKNKINHFCHKDKIVIIPNGVLLKNISRYTVLKKRNHTPKIILFMGELSEIKGVYDLIEAIRILYQENRKIRVLLCGDGEIEKVVEQIYRLGLEQVIHVPGWIIGKKKKDLLNEAYLYVLPSYYEGLPMSILEAMATGTPVISTNVGGIPEVVQDGYSGFLVPKNAPREIAHRIDRLLNDAELWERQSQNALNTIIETFCLKKIEKELINLYASI